MKSLNLTIGLMAQCYVAEAANGGFEESLASMKAYKEMPEVD